MASIRTRRPAKCGQVVHDLTTFQYSASSDDDVQESSSKIARGAALHTALGSGYKMPPCSKVFLFPGRENLVPDFLSKIGPCAVQVVLDIKYQ